MTALSGPILFNNSTGSDTAASGCGPATAISVMMQTSAGSNVATASWSGTISSGDLMYIPDSSFTGRKFNVVAVVGSGTLTFDDNWDDSSFGTSGYVGGKRATFDNADSRRIFEDDNSGDWTIETETNQSLTSTLTLKGNTVAGALNICQGSESTKTITQTVDAPIFTSNGYVSGYWQFKNLKLQNSNATKTNSHGYAQANSTTYTPSFTKCVFGDATNSLKYGFARTGGWASFNIDKCLFTDCDIAIYSTGGSGEESFISDSLITNCTSDGVQWAQAPNLYCVNTIFAGNGSNGLNRGSVVTYLKGCVFYGNTSHGVNGSPDLVTDCIFDSNGGYGISGTPRVTHNNAFRNNTSGEISSGTNRDSITLTADPFVDAANGDFNLNADAGGGATLRSTNYTIGG